MTAPIRITSSKLRTGCERRRIWDARTRGCGSKHKKRALWKESSATEGESLCSQSSVENNRKAAWRVGTFPTKGFGLFQEFFVSFGNDYSTLPTAFYWHCSAIFVENIRKAPPKEEEWWEETGCKSYVGKDYGDAYCDDGYADRYGAIVIKSLPEQKRFRNCGLETWQQARKE